MRNINSKLLTCSVFIVMTRLCKHILDRHHTHTHTHTHTLACQWWGLCAGENFAKSAVGFQMHRTLNQVCGHMFWVVSKLLPTNILQSCGL